jgi:ABC-type transport system substrate-binding protein
VARIFGKKGDYQVACFRGNQFVEPDQISDNYLSDNKANYGFYSNPEVDKALLAGRASADFATRKAAYFTVQEQLAKDVPGIALLYDLFGNITTDKVSDLPNPEANSLGALQLATVYKNG